MQTTKIIKVNVETSTIDLYQFIDIVVDMFNPQTGTVNVYTIVYNNKTSNTHLKLNGVLVDVFKHGGKLDTINQARLQINRMIETSKWNK